MCQESAEVPNSVHGNLLCLAVAEDSPISPLATGRNACQAALQDLPADLASSVRLDLQATSLIRPRGTPDQSNTIREDSPVARGLLRHGAGSWLLTGPGRAPRVPVLVLPYGPSLTFDALDLHLPPSAAHREDAPALDIGRLRPGCSISWSACATTGAVGSAWQPQQVGARPAMQVRHAA